MYETFIMQEVRFNPANIDQFFFKEMRSYFHNCQKDMIAKLIERFICPKSGLVFLSFLSSPLLLYS
jgi:hypothetical protein